MKIRPVAAEFFHVIGRTDMMKQIVDFRNFSNAPEKDVTGIWSIAEDIMH